MYMCRRWTPIFQRTSRQCLTLLPLQQWRAPRRYVTCICVHSHCMIDTFSICLVILTLATISIALSYSIFSCKTLNNGGGSSSSSGRSGQRGRDSSAIGEVVGMLKSNQAMAQVDQLMMKRSMRGEELEQMKNELRAEKTQAMEA